MFHFSRRTLWIIIYVTIPLIFILNQLGGEPDADSAEADPQRWSLDEVDFEQTSNRWQVDLPQAEQIRLSVVQPQAPAEMLATGDSSGLSLSRQGGQFVVTVVNPARLQLLETSVDFLVDWLPDSDERRIVVSGSLNDEWLAALEPLNGPLRGEALPGEVRAAAAVSRLTAPPMGSDEQLAFLIWVDVLEQRLGGYQPDVRWDHRAVRSQVLFNQTLAPSLFEPVTEDELEPVLSAYQNAAAQRQRRADQIHRYLLTTAVYELPLDFLLRQPERLAQVDLAAVNQQRQQSMESR
ncbi:hypothetical protein BGP77_09915 [Saccharospirillum sp. MSK14-1]|uniref:hypothetical protein n=1 Tax=Saccharospirillum sp. MSK14-1 TaxID=1897632 RepID=UPI000D364820|nr:hypothetical protein [Saccharospirillum sp. MSK14-1]PTY39055.1 hypothetical protein BGP77_09915 [Saccharospirillum sp. MSK14-1]